MSGVTFELQRLVTGSTLPMDIKCMLLVMILHASIDTAEGYSSQGTIAGLMSCSRRKVIYSMQELEQLVEAGKSPVRIVRTRRGKKGGTGRDSDLYRIEAIPESARRAPSDKPQSAECAPSERPKAQGVHIEPSEDGIPQSAKSEPQSARIDDLKVQTSAHDLPRDLPSIDPLSSFAPAAPLREAVPFTLIPSESQKPSKAPAPVKKPSKRHKRKASGSKAKKPQPPGTQDLKLHYVAEFERLRKETPEFGADWPAEMIGLGKLIAKHGLAKAKVIVTRAVADTYRDPSPKSIQKHSAMYQGETPLSATQRKPVERQQGDNPDVPVNAGKWAPKPVAPVTPIRKAAGQ